MNENNYIAHQLNVKSALPIAGFPSTNSDKTDVVIRADEHSNPGDRTAACADTVSEISIRLHGIASYTVRDGKEVVFNPESHASDQDVALFLRSSVFPCLLMQRGQIPFHASAVDTPEGALLFFGEVGVGKSVLAAAIARKGFPLMCDDMAALSLYEDKVSVIPSVPEFQLWGDAVRYLGRDPRRQTALRQNLAKYSMRAASWVSERRPVRAIFFLKPRSPSRLEFRTVSPAEATQELSRYLFRRHLLLSVDNARSNLEKIGRALLRDASCYEIACPRAWSVLPECLERITVELSTEKSMQNVKNLPAISLKVKEPVTFGDEKKPGFVLLASYPKSGNTWLRILLQSWRTGGRERPDLNDLDGAGAQLVLRHVFDEELGVNSALLSDDELLEWRSRLHKLGASRLGGSTLVKTHDLCRRSRRGELLYPTEALNGVVYVVRSPLDVTISMASHLNVSLPESARILNSADSWSSLMVENASPVLPGLIGSWAQNVASWLDEPDIPLLLVRYEDMLADTTKELRRVIEFLGLAWDEEVARGAIGFGDFNALQREEQVKGFLEKPGNCEFFFRKGKAGGWRESMPPQLAMKIVQDNSSLMRRLGYANEIDEVHSRCRQTNSAPSSNEYDLWPEVSPVVFH